MSDDVHYLDLKTVCSRIGVSRATLYRMIDRGSFPKSRQLGPNSVRWRSDEVTAWIMTRPHAGSSISDCSGRAAA